MEREGHLDNYHKNLIWKYDKYKALKEILKLIGQKLSDISGHSFQATDFSELHQRTLCNVNKGRKRE